jgi:hypothetical protein
MPIESEGFGSYGWEIEVSVEQNKVDAYIYSEWKYLRFVRALKAHQDWRNR